MLSPDAESAIQQIIIAISSGDYAAALALTKSSRCSLDDLAAAASSYGGEFQAPPFSDWDVVALSPSSGRNGWSVIAPLWSESEGGRSDLEVRFTVKVQDGVPWIGLDDVLVA